MAIRGGAGRAGRRFWLVLPAPLFQPAFQRHDVAITPAARCLPARQAGVEVVAVRLLPAVLGKGAGLVFTTGCWVAPPEAVKVLTVAGWLAGWLVGHGRLVAGSRRRVVLARTRVWHRHRYRYRFWYRYRYRYWYRRVLYGTGTVLARCWYGAGRFAHVRRLVLGEADDLDIALASGLVADDEAGGGEVGEQRVHVAVIVGQDLNLDDARSVLQAAVAVGQTPEAGEQDARRHR